MQDLMKAFAAVRDRGEDLSQLFDHAYPPEGNELAMRRMALSSAIRAYLAEEHRAIVVPLTMLGSAAAVALAGTFNAETNGLRTLYSRHVVNWPTAAIAADWSRYRAESRQLILQLRRVNMLKATALFAQARALIDAVPVTAGH